MGGSVKAVNREFCKSVNQLQRPAYAKLVVLRHIGMGFYIIAKEEFRAWPFLDLCEVEIHADFEIYWCHRRGIFPDVSTR
jgi:hypothetical protein